MNKNQIINAKLCSTYTVAASNHQLCINYNVPLYYKQHSLIKTCVMNLFTWLYKKLFLLISCLTKLRVNNTFVTFFFWMKLELNRQKECSTNNEIYTEVANKQSEHHVDFHEKYENFQFFFFIIFLQFNIYENWHDPPSTEK